MVLIGPEGPLSQRPALNHLSRLEVSITSTVLHTGPLPAGWAVKAPGVAVAAPTVVGLQQVDKQPAATEAAAAWQAQADSSDWTMHSSTENVDKCLGRLRVLSEISYLPKIHSR